MYVYIRRGLPPPDPKRRCDTFSRMNWHFSWRCVTAVCRVSSGTFPPIIEKLARQEDVKVRQRCRTSVHIRDARPDQLNILKWAMLSTKASVIAVFK